MTHPLIESYILHNHYGRLLGMDFQILEEGLVEYRLEVKPEHLATPLSAHGGLMASLVDAALGVGALSSVCRESKVVSTVEYKLNFLAPAFAADKLLAKSRVIQKGKRLLIVECEVWAENRQHKLLAKAMGTFNAYPAEKAGY